MIYFRRDGDYLRTGLNITFGCSEKWWKPWAMFIWVWFTPYRHKLSMRRLRIRTNERPFILTESAEVNVVENYLMMNGMATVPVEVLEDMRASERDALGINARGPHKPLIPPVLH